MVWQKKVEKMCNNNNYIMQYDLSPRCIALLRLLPLLSCILFVKIYWKKVEGRLDYGTFLDCVSVFWAIWHLGCFSPNAEDCMAVGGGW